MAPRATACLMLLLLGVAACESKPRPTPRWNQEAGYRWRELDVSGGKPGFTRMEPGKTLLTQALTEIGAHAAWRSLLAGARRN